MSVSCGDGVAFRTLQAISDLRWVARSAQTSTLVRLSQGIESSSADADLQRLVERDGCRIARPASSRLHQGLILAAALPNDDFEAFQAATAILLADRLQRGLGQDDLFWHWDAFHAHYALALPHVRAAIMQGFLCMNADGLVTLEDPPAPETLVTEDRASIMTALEGMRGESVTALRGVLEGQLPSPGFWDRHCAPQLAEGVRVSPRLVRVIRHLYESLPNWDPLDGRVFDPVPDMPPPVIPVIPY